MSGNDPAGAMWDRGALSDEESDALLGLVDDAFTSVLFARYGGAVLAVLARGAEFQPEQTLRGAGASIPGHLLLEMHLRGADSAPDTAGAGHAGAAGLTPIGAVRFAGDPADGVDDVHVLTEILDDHDPNGSAEHLPSHEGVGLASPDPSAAGHVPGAGLAVIRQAPAAGNRQAGDAGRRGWRPQPQRTRTSRGGGLGSNGHTRSAVATIGCPVAAPLLSRLGKALSATAPFSLAVARVVIAVDA